MPIQPLAPTLRLNSRENDPLPPPGMKVPASASWRRKARTSWRSSLASGGSSIGSKRKLKLIGISVGCRHPRASGGPGASAGACRYWIPASAGMTKRVLSSRCLGDEGPELVGAPFRDHPPEARGPHRLVAELLAPRPQPARRMVQRVLVRKPHRAVHLVGDRSPGAGRFAAAHLGDR